MRMDRRRLLRSGRSILAASLVPSLLPSLARAAKAPPPAALIVPLTGLSAALGRSMERAALLAQGAGPKTLFVLDSGDTPAGAAAAALLALKRGAGLILGPLAESAVRPVLAAVAGRAPVIAFSNDSGLIDSGAFLLGITAEQATAPLLHYAHGRGVRRVAVMGGTTPWLAQIAAAATRAGRREGLSLTTLPAGADIARSLGAADAPDALLLSGAQAALAAPARAAGVQPLIAFAGLDPSPVALAAIDGAWLSAPDPGAFGDFATSYEAANGSPPGVIAGLAYDAAAIAMMLARGGGSDRSALLAAPSFKGVCGDVRFRADGSAARDMAILAVDDGRYAVVDHGGG